MLMAPTESQGSTRVLPTSSYYVTGASSIDLTKSDEAIQYNQPMILFSV